MNFYRHYYITSISPLGFIKNGKNYNYYDDRTLAESLDAFITSHIQAQLQMNIRTDVAICWGKGKNAKFFLRWNEVHQVFKKIEVVPHPRWVMQYRRKLKDQFVNEFVELVNDLI